MVLFHDWDLFIFGHWFIIIYFYFLIYFTKSWLGCNSLRRCGFLHDAIRQLHFSGLCIVFGGMEGHQGHITPSPKPINGVTFFIKWGHLIWRYCTTKLDFFFRWLTSSYLCSWSQINTCKTHLSHRSWFMRGEEPQTGMNLKFLSESSWRYLTVYCQTKYLLFIKFIL